MGDTITPEITRGMRVVLEALADGEWHEIAPQRRTSLNRCQRLDVIYTGDRDMAGAIW